MYLKQNSEQNSDSKYFLQSQSANNRESSKNVSASSNPKDPYGYFPFNETAKPGVFSTYNYGFGTKLQMDFTLTDDGMVETEKADGTTEKPASSSSSPVTMTFGYSLMASWRLTLAAPMVRFPACWNLARQTMERIV